MSKDHPADFLATLKRDVPKSGASRVILIRSNRELKVLITQTLERLEPLGDAENGWQTVVLNWNDLQTRAQALGCENLRTALGGAELLFAIAPRTHAPPHPAQLRALGALTALLLRAYIEGHDGNGAGELDEVLAAVESLAPGVSRTLRTAPSERVIN